MSDFTLHTYDTAPEDSRPLLDASHQAFGMVPALHAVMAESPPVLEGYQTLHRLFQETSFDADELTVVWQAINVEHECHYCVPAHTAIAKSMEVDDAIIDALRDETPLPSDRLEALRTFTLALVRGRGHVDQADLSAFFAAGYGHRQVLEIVLGISQKVMSNYINHLAETPVDKPFEAFAWEKAAR